MKAVFLALFSLWLPLSLAAQAQDTVRKAADGPRITFQEMIHLYGNITQNSSGNCFFVFSNDGNEPLIVSSVQAGCGCTTPSWNKAPVMPGQSDTLRVHYDTSRPGKFNKVVTVNSNAVNAPVVALKIRGTVR